MKPIIEEDVSDEHIDDILLGFFEQWEAKNPDIGKFESVMTDIGRLFSGIDSVNLLFRFRERLQRLTTSLREDQSFG